MQESFRNFSPGEQVKKNINDQYDSDEGSGEAIDMGPEVKEDKLVDIEERLISIQKSVVNEQVKQDFDAILKLAQENYDQEGWDEIIDKLEVVLSELEGDIEQGETVAEAALPDILKVARALAPR